MLDDGFIWHCIHLATVSVRDMILHCYRRAPGIFLALFVKNHIFAYLTLKLTH